MAASGPTIDEITVADPPALWTELGFAVEDGACDVGTVRFRFDPDGPRMRWSLRDSADASHDGLDPERSGAPARESAPPHPNGVVRVDHVVAFSPELDRTVAALQGAGFDLRRIREEPTPAGAPRQAFFRLGEVILEVIQQPDSAHPDPAKPARLWGLAFVVDGFDHAVRIAGNRLGEPRDAVQEGRRIATLKRDAGSRIPIAFMTAAPAARPA
jgi:hypothetical protein